MLRLPHPSRPLGLALAGLLSLILAAPVAAQGGRLADRLEERLEEQREALRQEAQAEMRARIPSPPADPQQMIQNRSVQTALNYFEFDAGAVDGIMGTQTQAAVTAYQSLLNYPETGELTESERQFLLFSYQRAQDDPETAAELAETHPQGIQGLLILYSEQRSLAGRLGGRGLSAPEASLSEDCAALAGDGLPEADAPTEYLTTQLCQLRDVIRAEGAEIVAGLTRSTPEEVTEQCLAFEPALGGLVALLPVTPPQEVLAEAEAFVARSGQNPDQMAGIAAVCAGVGYEAERLDLALGSSVLLAASGALAYGEMPGHHLALGYGVDARLDLAEAWVAVARAAEGTVLSEADGMRAARLDMVAAAIGDLVSATANGAATAAPIPQFLE